MATSAATALSVSTREPGGSRVARRLRGAGNVLGVIYGGGEDPVAFQVDARDLRLALAHAGAVIDLSIDGGSPTPVVLKELVRHPVTGLTTHIDLLRVRLDQAIHATVTIEITGAENSPGVKEGGVLEQVTREVTIEALPADIPDSFTLDVSGLEINDTLTVSVLQAPSGVTILAEEDTPVVMVTPPRLQVEEEPGIEEETELVGEGEPSADAEDGEGSDGEDSGGDEGE